MKSFAQKLREANAARQAEWDPSDKIDVAFRLNELAGELGELCNILKKLYREALGIAGSRATLDQLREELADVAICCDLVLMTMNKVPAIPVFLPVDRNRSLVQEGVDLARLLGDACRTYGGDSYAFDRMLGVLFEIAGRYDISLVEAVATKFNTTSIKVGLKTRLEV